MILEGTPPVKNIILSLSIYIYIYMRFEINAVCIICRHAYSFVCIMRVCVLFVTKHTLHF